jgi:WD40 repeat protein
MSRGPAIANGTRIGPYDVGGWIGAGGMGEVYRARDARLDRDVAIKRIPEATASDVRRLQRFEQEARAAGQLSHPNVLALYDIGRHEGAPYIVSELLLGESLGNRLREGPLPWRKAVDLARQTAAGLAAAHDRGIVHRDVKPENLFVTSDGRIKILDFGVAKLTRPNDEEGGHYDAMTETDAGTVVGTAGYMSPEQVRGEPVDARSDIFAVGSILFEMLTGRPAFVRGTPADTIAAILKEEPQGPLPDAVPAALVTILSRCLEKTREQRFQSARDLAFGLEVLTGTEVRAPHASSATRSPSVASLVIAAVSLVVAAAGWLTRGAEPADQANPLANAQFIRFTNWDGAEEGAEISPDGKWVAFLSDRAGEFDLWVSQVGTGHFSNLTADLPPLAPGGAIVRKLGFSADGTQIWFNAEARKPLLLMPLTGGPTRPLLREGTNTPAWSPDGQRVVYFGKPADGADPMFVADRTGADERVLLAPLEGMKRNNPVWSPDGEWIYFVSGSEPQDEMDIDVWRVRSAGGAAERLTEQHAAVNFLAPIDSRALLYTARAEDGSGPWLWTFDVERKAARRLPLGVDQYTSVAASRDGRRIVATVANPSASLWRVPVLAQPAEERDAQLYALPVPTGRAMAPRFGGTALFYLSARGTSDGLWKVQDGQGTEVWRGVDGPLSEPPAVSPDGRQVAIVVRRAGKRHLSIMLADGTNPRSVATSIEIEGAAGQSAASWSPDGKWIVTGGRDAQGPALFRIPVDGRQPERLIAGKFVNPVWSPKGDLIVFAGRSLVGRVALVGVRPDGVSVDLPEIWVRPGGYRFLPDGSGLVYLPGIHAADFWLFDFAARQARPLTRLDARGGLRTFDVTPDGQHIVFDRSRENSDIVLIDRTK